MKNTRRFTAVLLIAAGAILTLYVLYLSSNLRRTVPFSPYALLASSWNDYKERFINPDGRVVDDRKQDVSTSEAQSYALLRAVYLGDKESFDNTWNWTKNNMQKDINLFGWRWGKLDGETYGFMPEGGENSATDADSDIALSLIFASERWNDAKYLDEAKKILASIWLYETAEVSNKRYLVAGKWAIMDDKLIINPSYFSPYAWRIFARVDTERNWLTLIDPAYDMLMESTSSNLDKNYSANLPPDWVSIDTSNGNIGAPEHAELSTNYSYDAMRVPFRIALDYIWFNEPKAYDYLNQNFAFLKNEYLDKGKINSSYTHDGIPAMNTENPAMYATSLGYFLVNDKKTAEKIYEEKILKLYSNKNNTFDENIPYYEQNWLWFGVSLYNEFFVNLTEND